MRLRARQAERSDFPAIYRFVFENYGITNCERSARCEWEALQKAWTENDMAIIALIVDDTSVPESPRPVAYQQIRFVSEDFIQSFQTQMPGYLLRQAKVLLDQGTLPGLTKQEVLKAHQLGRVHICIDYYGWDEALPPGEAALARDFLHRSFQYLCRGYNLESILVESIKAHEIGLQMAQSAGFSAIRTSKEGCIFHRIIRSEALEGTSKGTLLSPFFAGGKRRLSFSAEAQMLLLAALWGYSDTELAKKWNLSVDAIRSRWKSLYIKVDRVYPYLLPNAHSGSEDLTSGQRGREKKETLLNFLRDSPHELGPVFFLPPNLPNESPDKRSQRSS